MAAALIGVVGVLAGALLGRWMDYWGERHRQRSEARVSAHLIATELGGAALRATSTLEAGVWGSDQFVSRQWASHATKVAGAVRDKLLTELVEAYGALELIDGKRGRGVGNALSSKDRKELETGHTAFYALAGRLKDEASRQRIGRGPRPLEVVAAAVVVVLVAALAVAALQPRAAFSDASVAAALQDQLPARSMVDCSHVADSWHCDVASSQAPGPVCPRLAQAAASPELRLAGLHDTSKPSKPPKPPKPCGAGSPPLLATYDVAKSANGLVAIADPADFELPKRLSAIAAGPHETSLFKQATNWLLGK